MKKRGDLPFALSVVPLYLAVLALLAVFHEPWRDELQSWMIVRDSPSLADLFYNTRYEGHPSGWFLLLFGMRWVAPGFGAVVILHLAIAAATAWLILRYAPFTRLQRALLVFGYFFLYEYAVIARNYAPGVLLVVTVCVLWEYRQRPAFFNLIALAVAGMMLTNFYAFFLGLAFALLMVHDVAAHRPERRHWRLFLPGLILLAAGIILFLADTWPPPDYGYARNWAPGAMHNPFVRMFDRACRVFLPLPEPSLNWWNSVWYPNQWVRAVLGILLLTAILRYAVRGREARLFLVTAFVLILGFSLIKFNGYLRHNGHLYIAFIVAMWIGAKSSEETGRKAQSILFTALLAVHALSAAIAGYGEIRFPFSRSADAAGWLLNNAPSAVVVGYEDTGTSAVAARLDRPLFYVQGYRYGSWIRWDQRRLGPAITTDELVRAANSLNRATGRPALLLLTAPVETPSVDGLTLRAEFTGSVEPLESYWIYEPGLTGSR